MLADAIVEMPLFAISMQPLLISITPKMVELMADSVAPNGAKIWKTTETSGLNIPNAENISIAKKKIAMYAPTTIQLKTVSFIVFGKSCDKSHSFFAPELLSKLSTNLLR